MLESATAKLHAGGRLTLPKTIREAACLEDGEELVVEIVARGIMLMKKRDLEKSQAWCWILERQEGEREADEDIQAGRVIHFNSDEEFLEALDRDFK